LDAQHCSIYIPKTAEVDFCRRTAISAAVIEDKVVQCRLLFLSS